ncbi:hypothetical protein GZ59_24680 [Pectobacterium atrosepticum]|uniref:DUF1834 family protein n=1 Tax=Pectobacterium atrosepticum TaxID=29471 RepID=UPI0004E85E64|nr:DUF1834 family protein [Pectobacterium atrosepticum]AIK14265.1 hypothetical protein GZ59_24680 [Pectobacterium atrosepticum]ATY91692.1 DUF1834 domain-containing protein [Pectobacterium atrosepticum]KFX13249.1 hypothetical protein JV34_15625 [Pectobacterium atrosepticum]KMK81985.1 hypothetical protein KCQ_08071 [Pectobacterium atrosepticum ICMP 1526]QXE15260.1 DUF1834 family protein [Pectobacterium atrosepticum]
MIIRDIELAMIDRLRKGLGRMAANVCSYGGELDGEPAEVARAMPAVWVTFGGIQNTQNANIGKRKYKTTGRFVVIVGERSVRSEESSRHGGARTDEVGTYRMVEAVRRLISGQDLAESGLKIDVLMPGRVRPLFNTKLENQALSVFACEFDTVWMETALENGKYPLDGAAPFHPDSVFSGYQGAVSEDDPDWLRTHLSYDIPQTSTSPDAEDVIHHENQG